MRKLPIAIGLGVLLAGSVIFAVMPKTKHVAVSHLRMAQWENLRGALTTENVLKAPLEQGFSHGVLQDAIYIAAPPPPSGSDAAIFLPQPLIRQWAKLYEGTTFTPPEDWAKKLGVVLTLRSIEVATDWTGLTVQIAIRADSTVTGATGTVSATGLLTYGGQGTNAKGEPIAKFLVTLSDLDAHFGWSFLEGDSGNLVSNVLTGGGIQQFADRLVFSLPMMHDFTFAPRQAYTAVVDNKSKHDEHSDFYGTVDIDIFAGATPVTLTGAAFLLPPIVTDRGLWLTALAKNPGSLDHYSNEPRPKSDTEYTAAIDDLKSRVAWQESTGGEGIAIVYVGSNNLISKLAPALTNGRDHLFVTANLHDATGSIWKEAVSGGVFKRAHIYVLARNNPSAIARAIVAAPSLKADPAKPAYAIEMPTAIKAQAYAEISLDPGIGGGLPKIPVTVDASANYTFKGTFGFEVASLPAGKALLFSPDLSCDLLRVSFNSEPFKPQFTVLINAETLGIGTLAAAGIGFDTDVVMNKKALRPTLIPGLDSVPKRIAIEGPKAQGLKYSLASAEMTLSPTSVSRVQGGVEALFTASIVPGDAGGVLPDRSSQEEAQQHGLDQLQQDRTSSRSCPAPGAWQARIGPVQFSENSDVIKALTFAISTGAISAEDLVVEPVKNLLKGDPSGLVTAEPEIKALRDVVDRNLSPNSDVRKVVDNVDDAVHNVVQKAVAQPAAHVADQIVHAANKACTSIKRRFSKHPC